MTATTKTTGVRVTANEANVLLQIAKSEYRDWDLKDTVWSFASPPAGCTERSLGGIFASLKKKGLLEHCGWDEINGKQIGMVRLTDAGVAALPEQVRAKYEADKVKYARPAAEEVLVSL